MDWINSYFETICSTVVRDIEYVVFSFVRDDAFLIQCCD